MLACLSVSFFRGSPPRQLHRSSFLSCRRRHVEATVILKATCGSDGGPATRSCDAGGFFTCRIQIRVAGPELTTICEMMKREANSSRVLLAVLAAAVRSYAQNSTNALSTNQPPPRLPEVVVEGRQESMIGIASSATQGTVGAAELANRPILRERGNPGNRAGRDHHPARGRRQGQPVFPARLQPRSRHRLRHLSRRDAAQPAFARAWRRVTRT